MSLSLYCAFEFQRGTAQHCVSRALLKFPGVRELLHRVCHEIVMHRVNVGTSCGLWSLRVWAFTIRTSSVSMTWELVRKAVIHSAPTESELLGVDPAIHVFTYLPSRGFCCSLQFETCCSSGLWGKRDLSDVVLGEGGKHVSGAGNMLP